MRQPIPKGRQPVRVGFSTLSTAIEFTAWSEWLGMPIDTNSLKEFSELEIVAHCLNEMTYAGFEQEEINSKMDRIKNKAECLLSL